MDHESINPDNFHRQELFQTEILFFCLAEWLQLPTMNFVKNCEFSAEMLRRNGEFEG
jgi:hypothetical protein